MRQLILASWLFVIGACDDLAKSNGNTDLRKAWEKLSENVYAGSYSAPSYYANHFTLKDIDISESRKRNNWNTIEVKEELGRPEPTTVLKPVGRVTNKPQIHEDSETNAQKLKPIVVADPTPTPIDIYPSTDLTLGHDPHLNIPGYFVPVKTDFTPYEPLGHGYNNNHQDLHPSNLPYVNEGYQGLQPTFAPIIDSSYNYGFQDIKSTEPTYLGHYDPVLPEITSTLTPFFTDFEHQPLSIAKKNTKYKRFRIPKSAKRVIIHTASNTKSVSITPARLAKKIIIEHRGKTYRIKKGKLVEIKKKKKYKNTLTVRLPNYHKSYKDYLENY